MMKNVERKENMVEKTNIVRVSSVDNFWFYIIHGDFFFPVSNKHDAILV